MRRKVGAGRKAGRWGVSTGDDGLRIACLAPVRHVPMVTQRGTHVVHCTQRLERPNRTVDAFQPSDLPKLLYSQPLAVERLPASPTPKSFVLGAAGRWDHRGPFLRGDPLFVFGHAFDLRATAVRL